MDDSKKTTGPDSFRPEAWTQCSKKRRENEIAEWDEENAKLQAARCNRGLCEVLTNEEDYFKMITDARLKLEKGYCSCFAVCCEGRQSWETSDTHHFHWRP